jgi:dTDP-4-dehydrorhamnose reductase
MEPDDLVRDCLLLTGVDGYVGQRLKARLASRLDVVGLSRSGLSDVTCDLADATAVTALARDLTPRWIVHAAGNKNISACERTPELAFDANVTTTLNLLRAWPGVPLLYVSTDYVFDGTRGRYTESSPVAPMTAYGRSKLCAELGGRLIAPRTFTSIRVSALYDKSATFLNFLSTELSAGRSVDCFSDAYYSPTYFDDFAAVLLTLLEASERPPIVHIAGARTSRYTFGRQYAAAFGFDDDLIRRAHIGTGATPLYPDLSLATPVASATLAFVPTDHCVALCQIARGGPLADSESIPPLRRRPRANAGSHQRRPVGRDQLHRDSGGLHARRPLSSRHA